MGKQKITIMLGHDVVMAYKAKAGGKGYQTLINETLRNELQFEHFKSTLREVLREELNAT